MTPNLFLDAQASLFAFCQARAAAYRAAGLSADLAVVKFDAHADLAELPETDVLGVAQYAVETDGRVFEVTAMIGVSTLGDTNLFRLDQMINDLYGRLLPDRIVPRVDAATGAPVGTLKAMAGTAAFAVARTQVRPLRFIGVRLGPA